MIQEPKIKVSARRSRERNPSALRIESKKEKGGNEEMLLKYRERTMLEQEGYYCTHELFYRNISKP